jgi:hypothetical protein
LRTSFDNCGQRKRERRERKRERERERDYKDDEFFFLLAESEKT